MVSLYFSHFYKQCNEIYIKGWYFTYSLKEVFVKKLYSGNNKVQKYYYQYKDSNAV